MSLLFYIVYVNAFISIINADVIVETKSGKVAGIEVASIISDEKYFSFMGIPYAQPPVGELRFMAPVPHPGWDDVLPVKRENKSCAQFNSPVRKIKKAGFCGNEDCLHLSIHTPKLPNSKEINLPVIVFIYNEMFKISYNASMDYKPDFFMNEDVILVTVNHRLGSLGFLAFEDDLLPGNNGIRDVILALEWIKTNINSFGGDPTKITLMGSQGGATLVDIILQSAKAKGLFSAAILQSGTSRSPIYFGKSPRSKAISLTEVLEDKATTSASLIQRLSGVPAMKIMEADMRTNHPDDARAIQRGIVAFGPVIESDNKDAIITRLPENNQNKLDVPVMIGFNSRESIESGEPFLHKPQYLTYADRDFLFMFPKRVNYHFQINDQIYYKAVQEIKDFYFDESYIKISRPGEYFDYLGDIFSFYYTDSTIQSYTNTSNQPIYYYMFDYSGELNFRKKASLKNSITIEGTYGASVGDELCYLFICSPHKKIYKKLLQEDDSEEIKVLKTMVKLWTNFAKTGNPTPSPSEFVWTPATKENKECLIISDELKMKSKLYDDKVKFWDEFIAKYEKMAVNGVVKDDNLKDEL